MRFRESTAQDGARVVQIWRDAVDATHDFLSADDRRAIETEVQEYLPQATLWLVVDDHDRALGFMGLSGSHMDCLFVDPLYHGQGIGRCLVQYAQNLHSKLTTDVNEQNLPAVSFYESLGFSRVGRSSLDGQGRPYPLIHMQLGANS